MTSSITKLKSSIIEKGNINDSIEDEPAMIEGIYGTKGFYFQQRRGRLDLRGLAQIDLERVIRDVDVDILQMHLENITFCNLREDDLRFITDQHVVKLFRVAQLIIEYLLYAQEQLSSNLNSLAAKYAAKKRSLLSKRKELEELQENSKVLRAQLRSKKKGIKTLEALLKDASNRERSKSNKRSKQEPPQIIQPTPAPIQQEPPPSRPFTKLYVSGPNGWCIEFNVRNTSTVGDLKRDVRQAFISKKDIDEEYGRDPVINLIYQGRVLLPDSTIEDIEPKYGDTIVAVIEKSKDKKPIEPKVDDPRSSMMSNKEIMEFLTRQHEISANEMREGWQNLVQTLAALNNRKDSNPQDKSLNFVDERLAAIERYMKDQLQSQTLEMKNALSQLQNRKLIVGDLESDNDDRILSREEIERRLRSSNNRIQGLETKVENSELSREELKRMITRQSDEISELKRMLQERSTNNTPQVHIHNQPPQIIQQYEAPAPQIKRSNRNRRSPQKIEEPELIYDEPPPIEVSQPILPIKKEPVIAVAAAARPKLTAAQPPIQIQKETPKPVTKSSPSYVKIYFSPNYNKGLLQYGLKDGVEISVLDNISSNDLVFEIRRKIAEKAGIQLPRVSLQMNDKKISLGIDVDSTKFTASTVSDWAESGELRVEIEETITDSQIDLLMNQWEKSPFLSDNESPRNSIDTKDSKRSKLSDVPIISKKNKEKELRKSEEIYRKTLSESLQSGILQPEDFEDDEEENKIEILRKSLGNLLEDLSDKDRLTDDEYYNKKDQLQKTLKTRPQSISDSFNKIKSELPGDLILATHSGSEDYSSSDGRNKKKMGVATMKLLSTSQGSLRLNQTTGTRISKRDYDSTNDDDEDFTLTGSLSKSLNFKNSSSKNLNNLSNQSQESFPFRGRDSTSNLKLSNQSRRYSSNSDSDGGKSDHKDSLQYTRDSLSTRGFDDTIDTINHPINKSIGRSSTSSRPRYDNSINNNMNNNNDYDDDDNNNDYDDNDGSKSAFDITQDSNSFNYNGDDQIDDNRNYLTGTNTQSAGTYTSDLSTGDDILDFNQTVNTDISMPGGDVLDRVNAYERAAASNNNNNNNNNSNNSSNNNSSRNQDRQNPTTPSNSRFTTSSRGTASPFDTMNSDIDDDGHDDGSLDLSQSNDVFGNMIETRIRY